MQVDAYEKRCQKKFDQLNRKMNAIADKKDKEWLKLRQQKIAYEARLRNRRNETNQVKQLTGLDDVIKSALALTASLLDDDQLYDFKKEIKARLPELMWHPSQ